MVGIYHIKYYKYTVPSNNNVILFTNIIIYVYVKENGYNSVYANKHRVCMKFFYNYTLVFNIYMDFPKKKAKFVRMIK